MAPNPTFALSLEERRRFYADGYLGLLTLCSAEEMDAFRRHVLAEVLPTPGPWDKHAVQMRHLDQPAVHALISRRELVDRVASLFGPDVVVWRTNFFNKEPGGKEVPWHQDVNFWQIDPPVNLTAWIALDAVTVENACVQVIPGTHKKVLPHVPAAGEMIFSEMCEPRFVEAGRAVNMVLRPGQFFIFNERVLHHSEVNRSSLPRHCLVVRLTVPFVHVPPLYPGYRTMLLSGEDRFGLNENAAPCEAALARA